VVKEKDNIYFFSSHFSEGKWYALLARTTEDGLSDPDSFEYLSSLKSLEPQWDSDYSRSIHLTPCASEFSVSYNHYLGCYLMAYVDDGSKSLFFRTANYLWGPYSEPISAGKLPYLESAQVISLGFEHPQFSVDGGRVVYLSYSQPHFTQNALVAITFR